MEEKQNEEKEPQKNPAEGNQLTAQEIDDLKHKAEVSSQNYERLKKEEEKNAVLSQQVEALTTTAPLIETETKPDDEVKKKLEAIEKRQLKSELIETQPILKEVWNEFEEYHNLPENQGMPLQTAAKAFVIDKNLGQKPRVGLEEATGGDKTPPNPTLQTEELKNLRENDYDTYRKKVKAGEIKF